MLQFLDAPSNCSKLTVVLIHSFTQICSILTGRIVLALVLTGFQLSLGVVALGAIIMGFFIEPIVNFSNNHVTNRQVGMSGDIFAASELLSSDEGAPAPA